ncbi:MAG: prenyltransferase/squalene oxidase repeat-containing protein [Planctomycetota bacterium]
MRSDGDVLIYVGDLLAPCEMLLKNETLRLAVTEGRIAEWIGSGTGHFLVDELPRKIVAARARLPRELTIVIPSVTLKSYTRACQALMLLTLMAAAPATEYEARRADVERLVIECCQLAESWEGFALESVAVFVDAEASRGAFEQIVELCELLPARGIAVERADDRLRVTLNLESWFVDDTLIKEFFENEIFYAEIPATVLERLRRSLASLAQAIELEVEGPNLRLTMHGRRAGDPAASTTPRREFSQLGSLWLESPPPALFVDWSLASLTTAWTESWACWERWAPTPIGKLAASFDSDDFLGALLDTQRRLRRAPASGTCRLNLSQGIEFVSQVAPRRPSADLATSALRRLVPSDALFSWLASSTTGGELLADAMSEFENRMGLREFAATLQADPSAPAIEVTIVGYYERFARARQLIREGLDVFDGPCALVADNRVADELTLGRIKHDGTGHSCRLANTPLPELAVILECGDAERAAHQLDQLYGALVQGFLVEETPSNAPPFLVTEDLGIVAPTRVFSAHWFERILKAHRVIAETRGDWRPHLVVLDDKTLLVSTSISLSQRILRNRDDSSGWLSLPAVPAGTRLVSQSADVVPFLRASLAQLRKWHTRDTVRGAIWLIFEANDTTHEYVPTISSAIRTLRAFEEFLRLAGSIREGAIEDATTRTHRWRLSGPDAKWADAYARRIRFQTRAAELNERVGDAIEQALAWLCRHQNADGAWSAGDAAYEHCTDGVEKCPDSESPQLETANDDASTFVTSLAMLALLGAANTHRDGELREFVQRAVDWLLRQQQQVLEPPTSRYRFHRELTRDGTRVQAIATLALAELYFLSRDKALLREAVTRAVEECFLTQQPSGGWGTAGLDDADTVTTTLMVAALRTATTLAGSKLLAIDLERFDGALANAKNWYERVTHPTTGIVRVEPTSTGEATTLTNENLACTGMAGLARLMCGERKSAESLVSAVKSIRADLAANPAASRQDERRNLSGNYFTSYFLFQIGGGAWHEWNLATTEDTLQLFDESGCARGSFQSDDPLLRLSGRAFATALCAMTLEVRHRYVWSSRAEFDEVDDEE